MLVLPILLFVCVGPVVATDYCNIGSCGQEHTMCKYPSDKAVCAVRLSGLKADEKKIVLDLHNKLRSDVASKGTDNGLPTASDMRKLSWDDELETIAQRWALQCQFGHDACRNTETEPVGQNAAMQGGTMSTSLDQYIEKAIYSWFDEYKLITDTSVLNQYVFSGNIGHFTQLVWAETDKLGCGMIVKEKDAMGMEEFYLYCNYAIAGNMMGDPVYLAGSGCSKCPNGMGCSSEYPGLCGGDGGGGGGGRGSGSRIECVQQLAVIGVLVSFWVAELKL